MTKTTLERITSVLIKPIIELGIVGTLLAINPHSANAQTLPNNSDTYSTETAPVSTVDTTADSFEATEAKAKENCKNTTLESKLQSAEQYAEEYGKSDGRSKEEISQSSQRLKTPYVKVCSDTEFTTELNKIYNTLNETFGFTSKIDIKYITKNHEALKQRLKEISPAQLKHNSDYFYNLFSEGGKTFTVEFLGKYPDNALSLCLGEAPEKYILALNRMIGKTDVAMVYVALMGLLSNPADMINVSYKLSELERKGFKKVSETAEISHLLREENFDRIKTVSKPALLYYDLGITQFEWFSTELLERTINTIEHPTDKPAAIYVLTRQPQINGMMVTPESNDDYVLGELKDYAPIAIQPGVTKKLGEVLTNLHGRGVRAGNITFHEHGQQDQMLLDESADGEYVISKATMSEWLEPLNRILTDDATIVLSSCLTGKGGDNIARDIALATHRRTYAPSEEMTAGMFWYVSPDEVHLGRMSRMADGDRETFTPPHRKNKFMGLMTSAFDRVIDLTKKYYFPK